MNGEIGERDNRIKGLDYRKTKEAFRLINDDVARLDDEFVRLMLQSKYGAGVLVQTLEKSGVKS